MWEKKHSLRKNEKSNIQHPKSLTALKIKHIKTAYTTMFTKYYSHCELFNIIGHLHLFDKSTTFDKFTTKGKTSQIVTILEDAFW